MTDLAKRPVRLSAEALQTLRGLLVKHGFERDFNWAESVAFPTCPEDLIAEYAFVVVNSGMKAAVARGIYDRLWPAVLGADVAKPDRWLARLAESHGETVAGLCDRLARDLGWRVGTVDVVLWRACALGLCRPVSAGVHIG